VVNGRAVEYAARIALALNCTVQPRNIFHRKNYFYPDSAQGVPDQPVRRASGDRRLVRVLGGR